MSLPILELRQVRAPSVTSGLDLVETVRAYFAERQPVCEESIVLLLAMRHEVEAIVAIGKGSMIRVPLPVSEVFRAVLLHGVPSVATSHFHPRGEAQPSRADTIVLQRMVDTADLLDLELVDDLICNDRGEVYSHRQAGTLPRARPLWDDPGPELKTPLDISIWRSRVGALLADLAREVRKTRHVFSRLDEPDTEEGRLAREIAEDLLLTMYEQLCEAQREVKGDDA